MAQPSGAHQQPRALPRVGPTTSTTQPRSKGIVRTGIVCLCRTAPECGTKTHRSGHEHFGWRVPLFQFALWWCGVLSEGVPQEALLEGKQGKMAQIKLDKRDVSKEGHFKIDVLSSRALAQLMDGLERRVHKMSSWTIHRSHPDGVDVGFGGQHWCNLGRGPLCRSEMVSVTPLRLVAAKFGADTYHPENRVV